MTTEPDAGDAHPELRGHHGANGLVGDVLSTGRYFILIAVLGSFITSCAVLVYAFLAGGFGTFSDAVQHDFDVSGAKRISVEVITLVDLFLLGTVLYVVSFLGYVVTGDGSFSLLGVG
jgi:uncharacterized membrane protein YqhA